MAVVAFNCNKIKHTYWPFTFKDTEDENGKVAGRKIIVRMPSKGTFEKIQEFQEIADMGEDEIRVAGVIGSMHELIAEVLNNNLENPNPKKPKKPVRASDLENYDIEECIAILKAYTAFVDELKTDPN
ncbi:MAG: hypothetical protein HFG98_05890 [Dorea sp.]|nr:hypothetical protein [Dorea sp.]